MEIQCQLKFCTQVIGLDLHKMEHKSEKKIQSCHVKKPQENPFKILDLKQFLNVMTICFATYKAI
jgi:hypothetical protein